MKIRIPPASPHGAPTFHDLDPAALVDADLHRFITDHHDAETGSVVLMPGTRDELRPDFGPPPVSDAAVLRGLTALMWTVAGMPAAPDYLEVRWEALLAASREVLAQRRIRREPWVATVRRVRGDLVRTVDLDPRPPAASGTRVEQVPVGLIDQSPEQEGQNFSAFELETLADRIRETAGQVRAHVRRLDDGRFRLLIGVRPLRACQLAGLPALCCEVHEPATPLGTPQIPPPGAGHPLARLEAIVRFEVHFPAWPEFAPGEVVDSAEARRWGAELEHFRHEAAQDALADAEAALLEHEELLRQRREEEESRRAAEAEKTRQFEAAVEHWIAEHGTALTRERHRRGWLSGWDIAWQIAHAAVHGIRFPLLPTEPRPGTERRIARTDDEMEYILVLESDLAAAGASGSEVGFSPGPDGAEQLLATVHLPAPFAEATVHLAFSLPPLEVLRKSAKARKPARPRKKPAVEETPAASPPPEKKRAPRKKTA